MTDRYSVLLDHDTPIDVPAVARIVARALKIPRADASRRIRYSRCILLSDLEAGQADEIAAALGESGVEARVVAAADWWPLPAPRRVPYVEVSEHSLRIGNTYERKTVSVPWSTIRFLSLGQIHERELLDLAGSNEFEQMMKVDSAEDKELLRKAVVNLVLERGARPDKAGSADPAGPPGGQEVHLDDEKQDLVQTLLDIVVYDPPARLRLDQHDFCFAGLETELARTSRQNFRNLIALICERAELAFRTETLVRFLDDRSIVRDFFESLDEFEQYTDWALQLQERGVAGSPPAGSAGSAGS